MKIRFITVKIRFITVKIQFLTMKIRFITMKIRFITVKNWFLTMKIRFSTMKNSFLTTKWQKVKIRSQYAPDSHTYEHRQSTNGPLCQHKVLRPTSSGWSWSFPSSCSGLVVLCVFRARSVCHAESDNKPSLELEAAQNCWSDVMWLLYVLKCLWRRRQSDCLCFCLLFISWTVW